MGYAAGAHHGAGIMAYRSDYGSRIGDLLTRNAERQGQLGLARGDAWAAMAQAPLIGLEAYQGQVDRENQLRQQEAYQGYMGSLRQEVETRLADDRAAKRVARDRKKIWREGANEFLPGGMDYRRMRTAFAKAGDQEGVDLVRQHESNFLALENERSTRDRNALIIEREDAAFNLDEGAKSIVDLLNIPRGQLMVTLRARGAGAWGGFKGRMEELGIDVSLWPDALVDVEEAPFRNILGKSAEATLSTESRLGSVDKGLYGGANLLPSIGSSEYSDEVNSQVDAVREALQGYARTNSLTSQGELDAIEAKLRPLWNIGEVEGQDIIWDTAERLGYFTFTNIDDYRQLLDTERKGTTSGSGGGSGGDGDGRFPGQFTGSPAMQNLRARAVEFGFTTQDGSPDVQAAFEAMPHAFPIMARNITQDHAAGMSAKEIGDVERLNEDAMKTWADRPWPVREETIYDRITMRPITREVPVGTYWNSDEGLGEKFNQFLKLADDYLVETNITDQGAGWTGSTVEEIPGARPEAIDEDEFRHALTLSRRFNERLDNGESFTALLQEFKDLPNPRDPDPNKKWFVPTTQRPGDRPIDPDTGAPDLNAAPVMRAVPDDAPYMMSGNMNHFLINEWNDERIADARDRFSEAYSGINRFEADHVLDNAPAIYLEGLIDFQFNYLADEAEARKGAALTDQEEAAILNAVRNQVENFQPEQMPQWGEIRRWFNSPEAEEFIGRDPGMVAFLPYLQEKNWEYTLKRINDHPGWNPPIDHQDPINGFGNAWMMQWRNQANRDAAFANRFISPRFQR
jgi:hypothetical protein